MRAMTNKDFIGIAVILVFFVIIVSFMQNRPSVTPVNRPSPQPVNLYTNGVADGNTNNVANRVNFRQQPVGNNYS